MDEVRPNYSRRGRPCSPSCGTAGAAVHEDLGLAGVLPSPAPLLGRGASDRAPNSTAGVRPSSGSAPLGLEQPQLGPLTAGVTTRPPGEAESRPAYAMPAQGGGGWRPRAARSGEEANVALPCLSLRLVPAGVQCDCAGHGAQGVHPERAAQLRGAQGTLGGRALLRLPLSAPFALRGGGPRELTACEPCVHQEGTGSQMQA